MPLHQRIINHIGKKKEHIIAHIKRHQKKYIFGSGMALGGSIAAILLLIGIFLGINMMIGRSQTVDERIKIYKELAIFNVLDDFMHQRFNDISMKNNTATAEIDKTFPLIDAAYHNAKNLNEKYQAAKTIVEFAIKSQDLLEDLGYVKAEDIRYFNETTYAFYQIQ